MNNLMIPSSREQEIAVTLRNAAIEEIRVRALSNEEVGELFGLLPIGVELLLQEEDWKIDVAMRVASILGLDVEVSTHAHR